MMWLLVWIMYSLIGVLIFVFCLLIIFFVWVKVFFVEWIFLNNIIFLFLKVKIGLIFNSLVIKAVLFVKWLLWIKLFRFFIIRYVYVLLWIKFNLVKIFFKLVFFFVKFKAVFIMCFIGIFVIFELYGYKVMFGILLVSLCNVWIKLEIFEERWMLMMVLYFCLVIDL